MQTFRFLTMRDALISALFVLRQSTFGYCNKTKGVNYVKNC